MRKIYHLRTCNTCKKVLEELNPLVGFELRELKSSPILEEELEELKELAGSYSNLFNRRSQLYRKLELAGKELTEEDYKKYILEHYTFLKRPIVIIDDIIFAGNPSKIVSNVKLHL